MRVGRAVSAAVLGVVAALAGAGFVIARRLTAPVRGRAFDLTIRSVEDSGEHPLVVLDRNSHTAARGTYCLILENGSWAQLSDKVVNRGPHLVGRELLRHTGQRLVVGDRASWSGMVFSSPAEAGLAATIIDVPTAVGVAPAWLVPARDGSSSLWAIHIHGLGSPRAGTLRGVQVAEESGFTSLVVSYRNDGEGLNVGSCRSALGAAEIADVRAAVQLAIDSGARRVVLFGWSMGAAIALQLASEPELRPLVSGLVLESPVLDWVSTIRANCVRSGLPGWTAELARPWLDYRPLARLTGLTDPVALRRFDWLARAGELESRTLILHGTQDTSSPFECSARLGELRPDLVDLEPFKADHTMSWNSDPDRWKTVVHAWLSKHAARGAVSSKTPARRPA
jgi:pimeloyl-ACP methyl ester carboxylesterase